MKKVLILAYDFPPYNSVAAKRPYSWYLHFHNFDYYPVVITRHWDESITRPEETLRSSTSRETEITESAIGKIIRIPFNIAKAYKLIGLKSSGPVIYLRKMYSFLSSILRFYSFRFDVSRGLYNKARQVLKQEKFDIILATGEPFILFRYASMLSREFGVKWIADYRDGWSQNQFNDMNSSFFDGIRLFFHRKFERKIVKNASAITAAAPSYLDKVLSFVETNAISKVIYNGYEKIVNEEDNKPENKAEHVFTLAYSGRIYPHYPLESFFIGVRNFLLMHPGRKICIHFIGLKFYPEEVARVEKAANATGVELFISPRLSYADYIKRLKQSHVLLLFGLPGISWLNAKIFDYFYVNRKIILFLSDNDILDTLISETHSGITVINQDDLILKLETVFTEFLNNGEIRCNPENIEQYSREYQAAEMAKLIKQCAE